MRVKREKFFPGAAIRCCRGLGALLLGLLLGLPAAFALKPQDRFGLAELEAEAGMTPAKFASLFEEFTFTYYPNLQSPHTFLRDRSGDCDDYAMLASHVLSRHNYRTRLIRVELVGTNIRHVVCYVSEKKAYLDYNNRKFFLNLERSGPHLRSIASKVADSFEKNWTSVTEYTYTYDDARPRIVWTVLKTDPAERDPDRRSASTSN